MNSNQFNKPSFYLKLDLGNSLVESLALDRRKLELQRARRPRSIRARKSTCAPRRPSVRLGEVRELGKVVAVAEGNKVYSVVGEGANELQCCGLLATTCAIENEMDAWLAMLVSKGSP